ncbi:MAG: YdeI/OmpD-associated family protein [Gemmatimonadales bacterium]
MGQRDKRIDGYIKSAAPFAQPILKHLREVVHAACPEVEETLKWSMPSFMYHGILCGMAAFKQHVTFGFWKHALIVEAGDSKREEAMGSFGRLTDVSQLPSKRVLSGYIKQAMRLNEEKISARPKPKGKPRPAPTVPSDLRAAMARNAKAKASFTQFSPSQQREYVEWVTEAKRPETRATRIATTVDWLSQGKHRNWKYENC